MDLQTPAPPPTSNSDDGHYDLAAAPAPAAAEAPSGTENGHANGAAATEAKPAVSDKKKKKKAKTAPEKAKSGGFFKRGAKAEKAKAAAPEAPVDNSPEGRKRRRRRRVARQVIPSWGISAIIHVAILGALAAVTFSTEVGKKVLNLNSALVGGSSDADELLHVLSDPNNAPRDQAVGGSSGGGGAPSSGGGGGGAYGGIGTGPPTMTPALSGGGGTGVNEKNGLPGIGSIGFQSPLKIMSGFGPVGGDLGGGGMIKGDVAAEAKDIGEALDQLAREILRHLSEHKLTVVWLFDESESMKDDQKEIFRKFDRVSTELKINAEAAAAPVAGKRRDASTSAPLNHAIIGFGKDVHPEIKKPTFNIELIGEKIKTLKIDDSGVENTMHALAAAIETYAGMIGRDRKLLIVLVTDESGDDGGYVEEVHQMAVQNRVPIYVIGRQSLFGYDRAHLLYIDPVTKDHYWPTIKRGPETADVETLQYDGLHDRWDEQPSGVAPYELARLTKDTGGMYFLLPSEENMRVRQREKLYSIKELKEYLPDYNSRVEYMTRRNKSEFRKTLYEVIQFTKGFPFRIHFPVDPAQLVQACNEEGPKSNVRVQQLLQVEKTLRGMSRMRDREPDKRWQADYDLMLAQVVAYQVKAYEYGACLAEMKKNPPKPKRMPSPELHVLWSIDHSHDRKAPKELTEEKYQRATALLKEVIAKHPRTPWADLAQDELNRGLGCQRSEWDRNPRYDERAKLVPKY